jgi:acetyl esterase/lipase
LSAAPGLLHTAPVPWPWLFLAVTLVGAWFTFNAYLPHRRGSPLIVPSFFAGWLTGELSAHHFAWQLAATLFFVSAGALEAWPGWLGLGITLVSWAGLLVQLLISARTRGVVERALCDGLGDGRVPDAGPSRAPRGRLVIPFLLYDRDVEVVRDLRYAPGAGRRHLLDVYRPRAGASDAPVLLQIHGGAWVIGDKRQQALPLMLHLAARGWVCVAANYRLSPRATFPEHLVDVKLALSWTRERVADYGGDPDFVVITGGSAGGHLSSLAALTANDPAYQPGFETRDTSVAACVPFYGVYDLANELGSERHAGLERFLSRAVMKKTLAEDPDLYRRSSPLSRVHADAPPFFVIHGTHDSLAPVEEARGFVARLRACSASPVAYAELPGAQHAFELFHSLRTRHVVRGVERFLARLHADYRAAPASSAGGKRLRSASTTSRAPASTLSVPVLTTRS